MVTRDGEGNTTENFPRNIDFCELRMIREVLGTSSGLQTDRTDRQDSSEREEWKNFPTRRRVARVHRLGKEEGEERKEKERTRKGISTYRSKTKIVFLTRYLRNCLCWYHLKTV